MAIIQCKLHGAGGLGNPSIVLLLVASVCSAPHQSMMLIVIGFDIKGARLTWLVGSVAILHLAVITVVYRVSL